MLPALERRFEVLAPTLPGHAGGPELGRPVDDFALVDAVEQTMDEAGLRTAHIVGNSLGGYVALQLAARGRAESVVAIAPAGGWAAGDDSYRGTLAHFTTMLASVRQAVPHVDAIVARPEGRRLATQFITERYEHIPAELIAHQFVGAAGCTGASDLIDLSLTEGWTLPAAPLACPLRLVWGTEDKLLTWPRTAARFRQEPFEGADWVVMDGVGHCPQLDVPDLTAELILEFATGAVPGGTGRPADASR